jgi:hypothetical protein
MTRSKNAQGDSVMVNVRLPRELVRRVDEYVLFVNNEQPGLAATRTTGIRMLLHQALDAIERVAHRRS